MTRRSFRRTGWPSGVVSTAAMIGVLPGAPRSPHREGHVFLTPAGVPCYDSGGLGGSPIKRAFKGACRRAGIEGLRVHDTRHTFASWLVMNGTPLRTVAELLGHKSLAMVHRYSHLSPDHLRDAVNRLSNGAKIGAGRMPAIARH